MAVWEFLVSWKRVSTLPFIECQGQNIRATLRLQIKKLSAQRQRVGGSRLLSAAALMASLPLS